MDGEVNGLMFITPMVPTRGAITLPRACGNWFYLLGPPCRPDVRLISSGMLTLTPSTPERTLKTGKRQFPVSLDNI